MADVLVCVREFVDKPKQRRKNRFKFELGISQSDKNSLLVSVVCWEKKMAVVVAGAILFLRNARHLAYVLMFLPAIRCHSVCVLVYGCALDRC